MEEESKHPQFKSLISEKVGPHPKIFDQLNLQDINRLYHTILVIMVPGFKKDASHRFHVNLINRQASCHPAMQSPGKISKIYINGPDPSLLQYLEEFKIFKDLN